MDECIGGGRVREGDWQRIRELFHAALALPAEDRESFIDRECPHDARLRETVCLLLESDQNAGGTRDQGIGLVPTGGPLSEKQFEPPSRIGAYRIERELGRGGWGTVYVAEDPRLRRRIALKVLTSPLAASAEAVGRFEREAQLLARLSHPHIATVFSLERDEKVDFITMELVAGDTLAERLGRSRLSPQESLTVCAQVAEALEAAHSEDIIHCDLKPANIKVTEAGRVKVLDFGLARALVDPQGDPDEPIAIAAKATSIIGSPGYMSPEQLLGTRLDCRTDIWAFGCVLFECLAGRAAFPGRTSLDRITATLEAQPIWELLPTNLPDRVRSLLDRCLRKNPAERPQSMASAREELEGLHASSSSTVGGAGEVDEATRRIMPSAGPGRRRRWALVSTLLLLLLIAIGGWSWAREILLARAKHVARAEEITVSAPILGHLWTKEHGSSVGPHATTPWSHPAAVAYGLEAQGTDGGQLFVRDIASGELLWSAEPNSEEATAVFGRRAGGGVFECIDIRFCDLDGNGNRELLAHHRHDRWFPSIVTIYRSDGTRIGWYYHIGHLAEIHIEDLNGDGADEVLLAGTNNAPVYEGATLIILDKTFCRGASVDSLTLPECPLPDSSKVRVVFPQFGREYMDLLDQMRLIARWVAVSRSGDGSARISCSIGPSDKQFIVTVDEWLRPISASPTDDMILQASRWPDGLGRRFLSPEYRQAWLGQCYRYGAGIAEERHDRPGSNRAAAPDE
ncbi:MAG: protein kinase [Candidatus Eisenbacteria bacterium]|nr:protein kinase [Candidatus Eisenbacteria bacterium]